MNPLLDKIKTAWDSDSTHKRSSTAAQEVDNWQGQPYMFRYYKYIRTPKEMGMTTDGSMGALATNISSLLNYGEFLISGTGNAATEAGRELGDRYFLRTGSKCRLGGQESVDRYIYINNVPSGTVPFCQDCKIDATAGYKGLLPGMLQNLEEIKTSSIFNGFIEEEEPRCTNVELPTIKTDADGKIIEEEKVKHPIADTDIRAMNPCHFPTGRRPAGFSQEKCKAQTKSEVATHGPAAQFADALGMCIGQDSSNPKAGGGTCPGSDGAFTTMGSAYDNTILCKQLNKNTFAKFYITTFTIGMIILLFKIINK